MRSQTPPPAPDAASAPKPARLAPPPADASAPTTTVTGQVARWLLDPNGEVDGLLLEDGTQIAFAPHLSTRVLRAVELRDSVLVTGRGSCTPQTPPVIRATQIRSSASGQTIADEPMAGGPPPAPSPRDHAALTAMKDGGGIAALLRTGRGDVDGVVLDSGTVVRFPPHAGAQFAPLLKASGTLDAEGYGTRNAQGRAFEATQIGASATALQTVFPGPRGPAGGPGERPPAPGEKGARPAADGARPAPHDAASAPR